MRAIYYILKVILFLPCRILYPVKVIGIENLPKRERFVSVSNHLTLFDAFLMWAYVPRFKRFLAKNNLKKNPFIRFMLWCMGAIFINRDRADLKAMKKCITEAKKHPISVFPEGTRNRNNEDLQQIKGGAAMIAIKSDSLIVPIMIHHRTRIFKKNYIYIAPPTALPITSKDRLNSEAMAQCTQILTDEMTDAKAFLDNAIQLRNKAELKKLNEEFRKRKREYNKHIAEIYSD